MISLLRSLWRSLRLAGMFVVAGSELLLKRPATRQGRADWLHRFCARAVKGLGVRIEVEGDFPKRGALISNHLSYLDIVVFAAVHPCVFVSKAEIAKWPVVGWMTTMSGTVYVERGRGGSVLKARSGMAAAADAGLPVVFFPEGTTTNGETLLKFHSGMLGQAMAEGEPVTAAFLSYTVGSGNEADVSVTDDVCYWGEHPMWPHVFRFLGLRNVTAHIRFAERPIAFSSDLLHRKRAAVEARVAVAELSGGKFVTASVEAAQTV